MRKKILMVLVTCLCTTALFVGCGDTKKDETPETTQEFSMENKLLEYNEEGMKLLKLNYPSNKDMELALKNIGNEIPDLTLNKLDGSKLNLKKLKGKNVLLEIVQPECSYCMETSPIIHNVLKERDDVELVPIFIKADKDSVESYYKQIGIEKNSNTVIDSNNVTVSKFGLTQTPSLIYIDSNGKISFVKQSSIDEKTFKEDLDKAFKSDKIYDMLKE